MQTQVKLDIADIAEACRKATGLDGATVNFLAKVRDGNLSELVAVLTREEPEAPPDPAPADEIVHTATIAGK